MASSEARIISSDAAILSRLIRPELGGLSPDAAEALLGLRFDDADLGRLRTLVARNGDDLLTPDEQAELESYLRISSFLDLMQARARRSLKNPG